MTNQKSQKGRIASFAVMILFVALTLFLIFKNYELATILSILQNTNMLFILAACLCMFLYIFLEAAAIRTITRSLGVKQSVFKSGVYACVDLYFSAITPSSEGGQPLMIYTMNKDGISISKATITAVLFTNSFTGSLLLCTAIAALLSPHILFFDNWYFRICLIIGLIVSLAIMIGCLLLLRFGHHAKRLATRLIRILCKIRLLRHPEKAEGKVDKAILDFAQCRHYIAKHPFLTVRVLLLAFLQRVVFFTVPYFIYLSFGLNMASFSKIFAIQVATQMSVYALPIPGSAGATEAMLLLMYETIYTEDQAVSAMLLARGVTFYLNIIFCGLVTLINNLVSSRKNKELELS